MPPIIDAESATEAFLVAFQGHGWRCALRGGKIVPEVENFVAQAQLTSRQEVNGTYSVQLDLVIHLREGPTIIESCGGFGKTLDLAGLDAFQNFSTGSFHELFAALTGLPCSHVEIETWEIAGKERQVYLGAITGRSNIKGWLPFTEWFHHIEPEIRKLDLSPDLHWLRLYHGQVGEKTFSDEALLDNHPSSHLQACLEAFPWPKADGFYSVRIFMVIKTAQRDEERPR